MGEAWCDWGNSDTTGLAAERCDSVRSNSGADRLQLRPDALHSETRRAHNTPSKDSNASSQFFYRGCCVADAMYQRVHRAFQPSMRVREVASSLRRQLPSHYAAIHLRLGDFNTSTGRTYGLHPTSTAAIGAGLERAARALSSGGGSPRLVAPLQPPTQPRARWTLFVATDAPPADARAHISAAPAARHFELVFSDATLAAGVRSGLLSFAEQLLCVNATAFLPTARSSWSSEVLLHRGERTADLEIPTLMRQSLQGKELRSGAAAARLAAHVGADASDL